ncbi:short-chain fatty acyl-CoA regulator family protein [Streptomyces fagopyri]|uniref:short-chain fatty acyl-CoA regulator family protein n=1 Tax=Streptomyces fagopyri TaxID=2662397 RepID=UPI00381E9BA4
MNGSRNASSLSQATPQRAAEVRWRSGSAVILVRGGCRVCERLNCPQCTDPPLGRPLLIHQTSSAFVPYLATEPQA